MKFHDYRCKEKIDMRGSDWNILPNQASTDGQTDRAIPVYPLTLLRGYYDSNCCCTTREFSIVSALDCFNIKQLTGIACIEMAFTVSQITDAYCS